MTSAFSKSFVFVCPRENGKTAFSKSCVIGYRFHRIRVDDSRIRNKKVAFSNENGYVWSGLYIKLGHVCSIYYYNRWLTYVHMRMQLT